MVLCATSSCHMATNLEFYEEGIMRNYLPKIPGIIAKSFDNAVSHTSLHISRF